MIKDNVFHDVPLYKKSKHDNIYNAIDKITKWYERGIIPFSDMIDRIHMVIAVGYMEGRCAKKIMRKG